MEFGYKGNEIGIWLGKMLDDNGLNQADLARLLSVSTMTVSFWMTGRSFPSKSSAKSIVLALAPTGDIKLRNSFISENISVYEALRFHRKQTKEGKF